MIIVIKKKILIVSLIIIALCISIILFYSNKTIDVLSESDYNTIIKNNIDTRNNAILKEKEKTIEKLYDLDKKYGVWAYEHEINKMNYLHSWSKKQGIKIISIEATPIINWVKEYDEKASLNITLSTEYKYVYKDDIKNINTFRIGTYHAMDIEKRDNKWIITKDWYDDPFGDNLGIKKDDIENIKTIITKGNKNLETNDRREEIVKYMDKYLGAADNGENNYKYNNKYKDYNSIGGDCANFASQSLFEGGQFKKTYSWNYEKDGTKSWVNAQAFKDYIIYSGRSKAIKYGDYSQVLEASYQLSKGDIVAYEKKGKVVHICVVSGIDSKGYRLVHSHNTDRFRVPWDLGFTSSGIKFWLIKLNI
ncbi:amidase domain-containing protein [Senegalia massiliensis]|uniref:amidase domain-containing protein n=1 Tax=Senegalia massiliensis TaxID=1720316 RepID=UPI00102F6702|nr:amidase domain-containing protein [Senegalia massiliensis]